MSGVHQSHLGFWDHRSDSEVDVWTTIQASKGTQAHVDCHSKRRSSRVAGSATINYTSRLITADLHNHCRPKFLIIFCTCVTKSNVARKTISAWIKSATKNKLNTLLIRLLANNGVELASSTHQEYSSWWYWWGETVSMP